MCVSGNYERPYRGEVAALVRLFAIYIGILSLYQNVKTLLLV